MTKLSVNINKVATLRNARGGNNPDVIRVALDCICRVFHQSIRCGQNIAIY